MNIENLAISDFEIEGKLLELKENDFSKIILLPLFRKIYSCKVEFVGGITEKGRDIIIHKVDELGFKEPIAVQVKKIKPSENTAKKSSFQQLILQLSQAKSEGVVDLSSGKRIKVKKLIFVTPHSINQRTLDSHQGAFESLLNEHGVQVIDGARIIELIKIHAFELINELFNERFLLKSSINANLDNGELMQALDLKKAKDLAKIYCRLSLVIGGKHYEKYFNCLTTPKKNKILLSMTFEDSERYLSLNSRTKDLINLNIFDDKNLKLLERFQYSINNNRLEIEEHRKNNQSLIEKNVKIIKTDEIKKIFEEDLKKLRIFEEEKLREAGTRKVTTNRKKILTNIEKLEKLEKLIRTNNSDATVVVLEYIIDYFNEKKQHKNTEIKSEPFELLKKEIKKQYNTYLEYERISKKNTGERIPITILIGSLIRAFEKEKARISSMPASAIQEIRCYLIEISKLTALTELVKEFCEWIEFKEYGREEFKVSKSNTSSIEDVFDTRKNIALLGDAGSGKTTNLQVYAKRLLNSSEDRLIIFVTLNKLASSAVAVGSRDLYNGLCGFIRKLGINIPESSIKNYLIRGKACLLLDSIDEAAAEYPWIIDSLICFGENYNGTQIITSSRYSVDQLHRIPFAHISLLPFNDTQKEKFFTKWFDSNSDRPKEIITHLSKLPELNSVVTNPLSATILCVLSESYIPLPKTEASLYRKRFELLCGKFDYFKKIKRLNTNHDLLLELAKTVAFDAHLQKKVTFSREDVCKIIHNRIGESESRQIEPAIADLYKSEILLPTQEGNVSFGHLRFQEYLASEELAIRRDFSIGKILKDKWWQDVLFLYSQHTRDITWLVDHAIVNGYVRKVETLLQKLCKNQHKHIREKLLVRLNSSILMDKEDFPLGNLDIELDYTDTDDLEDCDEAIYKYLDEYKKD